MAHVRAGRGIKRRPRQTPCKPKSMRIWADNAKLAAIVASIEEYSLDGARAEAEHRPSRLIDGRSGYLVPTMQDGRPYDFATPASARVCPVRCW